MKNKRSVLFLSIAACVCWLLSSCKGDSAFAGGSMISNATDTISAYADTFLVTSHLIQPKGIISSPDSFLLGEVETTYGIMHAEVLTQLACPIGFTYPDNAEIDSILLYVYYRSWVGDGNAPLELEIRQMDMNPLYYWQRYQTNFDIMDYCSMDDSTLITASNRIVVASHPTDSIRQSSGYMPYVRFNTTPAFMARFGAIRSFATQESFDNVFKGLYLRSKFGGSTVLNVSDVGMAVFYHFSYNRAGRDTTVNDSKFFYSNSEVRQINHIEYLDSAALYAKLSADPLRNYVISPAGMYTGLHIPVRAIAGRVFERINASSPSRPYINSARVLVHVENVYDGAASSATRDDWAQPAAQMLLIDSAALNDFFIRRNLTSDTVAILSSLNSKLDSVGEYDYYYSFDLASILMSQFRKRDLNDFYYDETVMASLPDTVNMVLVPVTTASTSSSTSGATSLIGIDEQQTASTTIISASSAANPMRLEVVYSGFPYNW